MNKAIQIRVIELVIAAIIVLLNLVPWTGAELNCHQGYDSYTTHQRVYGFPFPFYTKSKGLDCTFPNAPIDNVNNAGFSIATLGLDVAFGGAVVFVSSLTAAYLRRKK